MVAGARLSPATTLSELYEQALAPLHSAGLDLPTTYHVAATATRYAFGYVIEEKAAPTPEVVAQMEARPSLASLPLVTQALAQFESSMPDRDAGFAIGLGYSLKGGSEHSSRRSPAAMSFVRQGATSPEVPVIRGARGDLRSGAPALAGRSAL